MRRLLVVTTEERAAEYLQGLVDGSNDEVRVVVPAVRQSRLQWLANEEDEAREEAVHTAAAVADALPVEEVVDAGAGDSDPLLGVEDALREFDADEILLVVRTGADATWAERLAAADEPAVGGRPVRRIEIET